MVQLSASSAVEVQQDLLTMVLSTSRDGTDAGVVQTQLKVALDAALNEAVMDAVEDVVQALRGSFSAEHGIGLSKLPSMRRRKDLVALDVMRAVKAALDPAGLMNPGKVVPD